MKSNALIALAIVIAGGLIAWAVVSTNGSGDGTTPPPAGTTEQAEIALPTTEGDYILGDPNSDLILVEYSDIECPFCKRFHTTMKQIQEEYDIAWVYRHFPLTQIHPNAPRIAEAAECVGEAQGNDAFWGFLDDVFEVAPQSLFPMDQLASVAEGRGLSEADLNACLDEGRFREKITGHFNEALAAGGQGTPFSVLLVKNEDGGYDQLPVEGALPVETMRQILDSVIAE